MDAALLAVAGLLTAHLPSRLIKTILLDSNNIYNNNNSISIIGGSGSGSVFPWGVSSLGLSLCLFALSIIEVCPTSWMVLIDNSNMSSHSDSNNDSGSPSPILAEHSDHKNALNIKLLNDDDMDQSFPDEQPSLDNVPSAWKTLHDLFLRNGRLPLTTAYSIILWSMILLVIIVLPSSVGIYCTMRVFPPSTKKTFNNSINSPVSGCPGNVTTTTPSFSNRTPMMIVDHEDAKKRSFSGPIAAASNRQTHWIRRLFTCQWSIIPKCICSWFTTNRDTGSILVLTESDNEQPVSSWKLYIFYLADYVYKRRRSIFGSLGGIVVVVSVFSTLCPMVIDTMTIPTHTTNEPYNTVIITHAALLTLGVSWLTATGILLSAIINGFGSVSLPYTCLAGLYLEPIHPDAIDEAELERDRLLKSLEDRVREVNTISLQDVSLSTPSGLFGHQNKKAVSGGPHLKYHATRSFAELGEDIAHRRLALMTEVEFLESLLDDINEDIMEMKQSHMVAAQARTTMGKIRSYVGIVFSVVLILRLVSSLWIIGLHNQQSRENEIGTEHSLSSDDLDIVTRTLLFMVGHNIVARENYDTLTQFVALVLAAFLSYSQVKAFIRTIVAINHRMNALCRKSCYRRSSGTNTFGSELTRRGRRNTRDTAVSGTLYLYLHLVAGLMSCYCLAGVILTKLMLPHRYRAALSYTLSTAEVPENGDANKRYDHELFHVRWYAAHYLFISSAAITAVVLCIVLGIQRQNTRRYLLSTTSVSSGSPTSSNSNSGAKGSNLNTVSEHRHLIDNMESV